VIIISLFHLKWNTVDVQLFTVMNISISSTWIMNGKGFMVTWHCILLEKYCVQSSSSASSAKVNKPFVVLKKIKSYIYKDFILSDNSVLEFIRSANICIIVVGFRFLRSRFPVSSAHKEFY